MIDFDTYIKMGEPGGKERAEAWKTAIGLQAVDGLKTSEYLNETAAKHIEGDITIEQVKELIDTYYQSKTARTLEDNEKEEADKAAANITQIINEPSFTFSLHGLTSIHKRIFTGIFKHAGILRDYEISKKEWVLDGASVSYGFAFEKNSWYFRNALVRANYQNLQKGIYKEIIHLERFFRNLLMGEENVLMNRHLHIKAKELLDGDTPTSIPTSIPTSTPTSTPTSIFPESENIKRLISVIAEKQLSVKEIMAAVGLKDRPNFIEYSLSPAMREGYVRMLYPDSPRHPRQKYLLTVKGLAVYKELSR